MSFLSILFRGIRRVLGKRITLMLVPHSQSKILNINIPYGIMALLMAFVMVAIIIGIFVPKELKKTQEELENTLTELKAQDKSSVKTELLIEEMSSAIDVLLKTTDELTSPYEAQDALNNLGGNNHASGSYATSDNPDDKKSNDAASPAITLQRGVRYINGITDKLIGFQTIIRAHAKTLQVMPSIHPLGGRGYLISGFRPRIHPISKKLKMHFGVDIGSMRGTPVRATANGTVTTSRYSKGGGNMIIIKHSYGFESAYMHMQSSLKVGLGAKVKKGQVIGYVGSTGYSTGPHLHYEIRINGVKIDPESYIYLDQLSSRAKSSSKF